MKKIIAYFCIALAATLILGGLGLWGYRSLKEDKTATDASKLPVIETDAEQKPSEEKVEEKVEDSAPEKETEVVSEKEPEQAGESGTVTLAFGGDICFHDPFANMYALSNRGGDIEKCIDAVLLSEMRGADICMVNNEFPYSDRGVPLPEKTYAFRSKPENVSLLGDMGVDIVSLANNHAYDHGEVALLDTLDILEEANVTYVGAGRNLSEASKPALLEINGVTVGIVAATQIERLDHPDTKGATESAAGVLRCFTETELNHFLGVVAEAKTQCDILVVYIHWGTENTDELDWAQPYQADLISKAGADLIVGAHPHCLQGLDSVNGVPVVYSLGNYWFNSKALDTALLKVVVSKEKVEEIQVVPARQQDCSTGVLTESEKKRVLDYLRSLSPNISLDENGYMTW